MTERHAFAAIGRMTDWPKVGQFVGLPTDVSDGSSDGRERLQWPRVVLIEDCPDGGVMLKRYTADGGFAGDTWHLTVEEAKEQAAYEFGDAVGEWRDMPPDIVNPVAYALGKVP